MLTPTGNRILVKTVDIEETTPSGLYIPDTAKDKPNRATVIATGPGLYTSTGERLPLDANVGDEIIFHGYAGTPLKDGGENYLLLNESDVLAIVK